MALCVVALLFSFTQLPVQADRPVRSIDLPAGYERMLVFFGYVDCPKVCPTAMFRLAAIYGDLEGTPASARLGVTFVNLTDAEASAVGAYARAFHPTFEGVQAGPRARGGLMRELGVRFDRDNDSAAGWHTDSVYLLEQADDGWRLKAVIPRPNLQTKTVLRLIEGLDDRSNRA